MHPEPGLPRRAFGASIGPGPTGADRTEILAGRPGLRWVPRGAFEGSACRLGEIPRRAPVRAIQPPGPPPILVEPDAQCAEDEMLPPRRPECWITVSALAVIVYWRDELTQLKDSHRTAPS